MKNKKGKITVDEKKLIRRYLIWCYKTTKEEFERIERKFTQLKVDTCVLNLLSRSRGLAGKKKGHSYLKKIDEFKRYIENKEKSAFAQKFFDKKKKELQPDYWYLQSRLEALEQTICDSLGKAELKKIRALYEEEMTRRILEAREHA